VLHSGTVYGHKDETGKVVSSAAIFPYGEQLASLGVVMVHPDHRRRGLGKEAVMRCMEELSGVPTMLVATAQGVPLYESLGYQTVGTLHKFLCDQYKPADSLSFGQKYEILPLTTGHFEAVVRLDQMSIGGERRQFLAARVAQAKEGIILQQAGEIVGYGLSVQGPNYLVIGSIVAPDAAGALQMINHLAQNHFGK
ncbi:GNAT family N-acetyltransferase, partial [Frankia sp. Cpl3]|nr:GNAT family N-acetyltransferase [Frankia sp. Cpl3]